ncbi:hypothetical protein [Hamadaea tsunoensis]|uniref:hypothetical protein n=1 Tax=Hamadaea tsunoensis TaxID=53368 RepID=UPI00040FCA24|nr:hypothetical protein [Hamadaea tsunoensis]
MPSVPPRSIRRAHRILLGIVVAGLLDIAAILVLWRHADAVSPRLLDILLTPDQTPALLAGIHEDSQPALVLGGAAAVVFGLVLLLLWRRVSVARPLGLVAAAVLVSVQVWLLVGSANLTAGEAMSPNTGFGPEAARQVNSLLIPVWFSIVHWLTGAALLVGAGALFFMLISETTKDFLESAQEESRAEEVLDLTKLRRTS